MSHDKVFLVGESESELNFDESIAVTDYSEASEFDHHIKYRKNVVEDFYPDEYPGKIEDLLRLSLGVFVADLATKRPKPSESKENEFRKFSRKIKLIVSVNSPDKWVRVKDDLEKTLSFMTYDTIELEFIQKEGNKGAREINNKEDTEYDMVSLFSGGLDSLGGAYYLKEKNKPLFLSTVSKGIKNGKVLDNLEEVIDIDLKRVTINRSIDRENEESSQFSRSFAYLSLGVALAYSKDIKDVIIPENGVVARQIGLNQGRRPTRTAHPKFIEYYQDFIRGIIDEKMNILNPLDKKTKAEVISLIEDEEAINYAYSCSHTRFSFWADDESQEKLHCGMGIPCLFRIVGLIGSNTQDVTDKLNLAFNPFEIDFESPSRSENVENPNEQPMKTYYREGMSSVLEMTQFAYELLNSSKEELVIEYPQLSEDEVYKMYQRFAENVRDTANFFDSEDNEKSISARFS